jgi:methionine-S-sulfoxide reductase
MKKLTLILILIFLGIIVSVIYFRLREHIVNIKIATYKNTKKETLQKLKELKNRNDLRKATFAGGCFWCMEGPFQETDGVEEVIAGYTGGHVKNPSYEEVVGGKTGHKESVQVYYDPTKTTYSELLEIYWLQIDPTDPGGQFSDRGDSYKTAIFYHDSNQKKLAEESKHNLENSNRYNEKIVTEILSFSTFYPAEDYHQDFYLKQKNRYQQYEIFSGRKKFKDEIKKKLSI